MLYRSPNLPDVWVEFLVLWRFCRCRRPPQIGPTFAQRINDALPTSSNFFLRIFDLANFWTWRHSNIFVGRSVVVDVIVVQVAEKHWTPCRSYHRNLWSRNYRFFHRFLFPSNYVLWHSTNKSLIRSQRWKKIKLAITSQVSTTLSTRRYTLAFWLLSKKK